MSTSESKMNTEAQVPPVAAPVVKIAAGKSESQLDKILGVLSSVRFGLVMLGLLLACCMTGMIIRQINVEGFQRYYQTITPAQQLIYGKLGLFDIYRVWYFKLLLAITGLNIILASIDRFPAAWQYIVKPKLIASPKFISAQMFTAEAETGGTPSEMAGNIRRLWSSHPAIKSSVYMHRLSVAVMQASLIAVIVTVLPSSVPGFVRWAIAVIGGLLAAWFTWWGPRFDCRISEGQGRITVFGQTQTWNRLGAYIVHVALLTIFIGGFITSTRSVGGSMEIRPGKSSKQFITLQDTFNGPVEGTAILPFEIECRDIQQKLIRQEGGLEAQNTIDWLSSITIKDGDVRKDLLVHLNNVGDYRGYRFFQSQFLPIGNAREITVSFEPVAGGQATLAKIPRNGSVEVPGIGNVRFVEFFADFEITDSGFATVSRDYNKPVAQLEITAPDGRRQTALALGPQAATELLGRADERSQKEGIDNKLLVNGSKVLLKDFEKVSFTHTLTIQYDPGYTPVYIGFTLLVLALCSVFFFSHQRVWAVIEPDSNGSRVYFGGNTNRNRPAFEARFNTLVQAVTGGGSRNE